MTKVETAKRDKYMVALLTSSTKAEAYKAAHISKATANRIEQEPDFIEQYNNIRRQAMEQTSNKLQGLAAKPTRSMLHFLTATSRNLNRDKRTLTKPLVKTPKKY